MLSEQVLHGRDGATTTTQWDTTGLSFSLKQTVTAANGILLTETTLNRDGTVAFLVGAEAPGSYEIFARDGTIQLQKLELPNPASIEIGPGGRATWITPTLAAAGAALLLLVDGWSNPAGVAESTADLSNDVRVRYGDGTGTRFAVVEQKVDGVWVGVGVPVAVRPDGILEINSDSLLDAIGVDRFNAIKTPPGITLTLPQEWVGPAGVPFGSEFVSTDNAGNTVWKDANGFHYTVDSAGNVTLGGPTGMVADGVMVVPPSDGSIIGGWKDPPNSADAFELRAILRENESGDTLAQHGFYVERLLESNPPGVANPDYRITHPSFGLNGVLADVYSPTTGNAESIVASVKEKADTQAPNIVVNLDDSPLAPTVLAGHIRGTDIYSGVARWPSALSTLIILKGDTAIVVRRPEL